MNALDVAMPGQRAVEAPRFALDGDVYRPGSPVELQVENRIQSEVADAFPARGHTLSAFRATRSAAIRYSLRNGEGTIMVDADPHRLQYAIGP